MKSEFESEAPPTSLATQQDASSRPVRPPRVWTARKVTYLLLEEGWNKSAIARALEVSQPAVQAAISKGNSRAICYFVAGILRVPPAKVWPHFATGRQPKDGKP